MYWAAKFCGIFRITSKKNLQGISWCWTTISGGRRDKTDVRVATHFYMGPNRRGPNRVVASTTSFHSWSAFERFFFAYRSPACRHVTRCNEPTRPGAILSSCGEPGSDRDGEVATEKSEHGGRTIFISFLCARYSAVYEELWDKNFRSNFSLLLNLKNLENKMWI